MILVALQETDKTGVQHRYTPIVHPLLCVNDSDLWAQVPQHSH